MKKYTLRIAHFGLVEIEKQIKAVKNVYEMTINCKNADINNAESYNLADVLFINIELGQKKIEDLIAKAASYAEFILYTDEESFKKLDNSFIDKFMDIWFTSDNMLEYKVNLFVKQMHNAFDNEFTAKQLDVLMNSLPDLIWCKDLDGLHLNANASFCFGAGKTKEQVLYRDDAYIWNIDVTELAEESNDCLNTDDLVIKEQGTHLFDEQVKFDSEMHQFKTYKSSVIGRNGESIATIGLARDVTDIWNTHEDFKKLISSLPIPTLIVNDNYGFVSSNESFEKLFKFPDDYLTNFSLKNFGEYYFKDDIVFTDSHNITVQRSFADPNNNSHKLYFAVQKSAIYNVFNVISGYFYIFTDITEDFERQEHLTKLAEIDELTQINNRKGLRKHFNELIPAIIENKQSLALCMIDIDYFKKYNDFYGHLDGDIIIKKIASLLESIKSDDAITKDKVYVARFGGEEFVIAINDVERKKIEEIIAKLEKNLANLAIEHKMSDVSEHITLSVGIAYYNTVNENDDISDIMKNADDALYKSKQSGRNRHTLFEYNK